MKKNNYILKKNFYFILKKKIYNINNKKKIKFFFNNLLLKEKNFFLTKLINIFIKNGLKKKIRNFIFFCFSKLNFNLLINYLLYKLNSKFYNKKFFNNRKIYILPCLTTFKKGFLIGLNWLKLALKLRKERTFKLKFFSEINELLKNKGITLNLKKNYFLESYKNLILNQKFKKLLIK